jgi:hypothetical protein
MLHNDHDCKTGISPAHQWQLAQVKWGNPAEAMSQYTL